MQWDSGERRGSGVWQHIRVEAGTEVTLDYDVIGTAVAAATAAAGFFDLRAVSPWGVASSGLPTYAGANLNGATPYTTIRLDSA